ncbi:MAG: heparinase II/III family protein, partial [Lentisphaerae bacterium]|nr:heparinase II/III family protein [Lentisphaerota bacterium]
GIGRTIATYTAVDGVTGEKGLYGYSAFTIQGLAQFLQTFETIRPGLIATLLREHPQLHQTWRFHIDTWCLQSYYPSCGDSGWFAGRAAHYVGVVFRRPATAGGFSLDPSLFTFLWNLYEATGDVAFVQTLFHANDGKLENLPWDLREARPETFQDDVAAVIAREGTAIRLPCVNKTQWHLAILRSGQGRHERALWLDYDSGNRHAHMDGMNLGLFAHGLDLMPDFGYPPVQFGGWNSPRSRWYMMTAAHNSVTVDGQNQKGTQWQPTADSIAATVTLWTDVPGLHAVRASGAILYEQTRQYERTVLLVDVSDEDFYVLDIFRVVGGTDHAKFIGSHFGALHTQGLKLQPGLDFGHETQLRNFSTDPRPAPGWSADWAVEDRYGYLPAKSRLHFRYTDLTSQAQASVCEAWVIAGHYNAMAETWVPRLMIRRTADTAPLASTFVGLIEAHENQPVIKKARRVPLVSANGEPLSDNHVAIEIQLRNGQTDLIMARDVENPLDRPGGCRADELLRIPSWEAQSDGSLVFLRRDAEGRLIKATIGEGRILRHEATVLDTGGQRRVLNFDLQD